MEAAEVARILEIVCQTDAIVIGGQSVNLWIERYRGQIPDLLDEGPFLSFDIDFLSNRRTEEALVDQLGGRIEYPLPGDHTPNAALFLGELGGRAIQIDFMDGVLGVKDEALRRMAVTIEGRSQSGDIIAIPLMHPLHCFQSRVANIDLLSRRDPVSIRQARGSVFVLRAFIDELLDRQETRAAQDVLRDLFYTLKQTYFGGWTHRQLDLRPDDVLAAFQDDSRLDPRWRQHQLSKFITAADTSRRKALVQSDR